MLLHIADWRAVYVPRTKIVRDARMVVVRVMVGVKIITAVKKKV